MRIVFFGTPAFAVPSLRNLIASGHQIAGVVTQPDRSRGRGHRVTPSPIKSLAESHGLPVLQPERLREAAVADAIRGLAPDLGVVAAYGRILPPALLDVPRLGLINVHGSLLPRWRGAAPVHRAIMAGDLDTGITIMRVVAALDAGPMLAWRTVAIGANETSAELEPRLAEVGADLLVETVDRMAAGPIEEVPQDERLATYAHRLERAEREIDWQQTASTIHDRIRGLQPWPLAAALLHGHQIQFLRAEVDALAPPAAAPGTIVEVSGDSLRVAAGAGAIRLLEVKPEGRGAMTVRAFLSGRHVTAGDRFEPLKDRA
jgi:methionyl-tRNA formyltransferase